MLKKYIPLNILILLILSCSKSIKESENNDKIESANLIPQNKNIIEGQFSSIKDIDHFKIKVKKTQLNQSLNIKSTGVKSHDIKIEVYENKKLIKSVDDYGKNKGERLDNILIKNITYTIKIFPKKTNQEYQNLNKNQYPSKAYKLTYSIEKKSKDQEPNNSLKTAKKITINKPITGSYSPFYNNENSNILNKITEQINKNIINQKYTKLIKNLDPDIFLLKTQTKKKVKLKLKSNKNIDGILIILEQDLKKTTQSIYYINSSSFGEDEEFKNLILKPNKKYYLLILGIPHAYKTSAKEKYKYKLIFTKENLNEKIEEIEDNNDFKKANIIKNKIIYGYISPNNDIDYYKINITKEKITSNPEKENKEKAIQVINITLKNIENKESLALELYDENKKLIKIYDNKNKIKEEKIRNYNTNNMNYFYLLVRKSKNQKNQKEIKSISYKLSITQKNYNKNIELEPNDVEIENKIKSNINQATNLNLNQKIKGYFNPNQIYQKNIIQKNDIDTYKIQLKHNKKYKLIFYGIKDKEITLQIYNQNAKPIKSFNKLITKTNKKIVKQIIESPNISNTKKNIQYYYIQISYKNLHNTKDISKPYSLIIKD